MKDFNSHAYSFQNDIGTQYIKMIINNMRKKKKKTQIIQILHKSYQKNQIGHN